MIDLIGKPLEQVLKSLENKGLKIIINDNNFCVNSGIKLVTNVKAQQDKIVLTVGNFIFDIKE